MPITLLHITVAMIHLIFTMDHPPPPPPHNSAGQRQAGGKSQAYPTVNVQLQASPEERVEVHTLPLDMLIQATDDQLPWKRLCSLKSGYPKYSTPTRHKLYMLA